MGLQGRTSKGGASRGEHQWDGLMDERDARARTRAMGGARVIVMSTLLSTVALAGCSWFEKSTPERSRAQQQEELSTDEPYPSLGDVPGRPTRPPALDRARIAQGLASDRENAQYTEEVIRRTPDASAPRPVAARPAPAPQVAGQPEPPAAPPPAAAAAPPPPP